MREYLLTRELEDLTGLKAQTWRKMRADGRGPAFVSLGNRVLYRRADLEAWMNSRRVETSEAPEAAGAGR